VQPGTPEKMIVFAIAFLNFVLLYPGSRVVVADPDRSPSMLWLLHGDGVTEDSLLMFSYG